MTTDTTTYIGIDPGWSGAVAWINGGDVRHMAFGKLTERDVYDAVASIIAETIDGTDLVACLEHVHSMPKQGIASAFKFGKCFGLLEMTLIATGIPYTLVSPQKWQSLLGCRSGGDKNVTKRRAQQLFPSVKVTHAIADACLLAEYCRRVHVSSQPRVLEGEL